MLSVSGRMFDRTEISLFERKQNEVISCLNDVFKIKCLQALAFEKAMTKLSINLLIILCLDIFNIFWLQVFISNLLIYLLRYAVLLTRAASKDSICAHARVYGHSIISHLNRWSCLRTVDYFSSILMVVLKFRNIWYVNLKSGLEVNTQPLVVDINDQLYIYTYIYIWVRVCMCVWRFLQRVIHNCM